MIAARRICRPRRPAPALPSLQRGDLVQQGSRYGVVAQVTGDRCQVWPIRHREREAASDVPVDALGTRFRIAAPGPVVVLAGVTLDLALSRQLRVGAVEGGLLRQIEAAERRAGETDAACRKWGGDREHRRDRCQPSETTL
jgi:hypothetical protein